MVIAVRYVVLGGVAGDIVGQVVGEGDVVKNVLAR